jgi:hypothetical protein
MDGVGSRTRVFSHCVRFAFTLLWLFTHSSGSIINDFTLTSVPIFNGFTLIGKPNLVSSPKEQSKNEEWEGDCDPLLSSRRDVCNLLCGFSGFLALPFITKASDLEIPIQTLSGQSYVTVPLVFTGSELLIYYRVDGSLFRAVVDTGSPFLMIPGTCGENTKKKSGCYREQGIPSGLPDTYEQFDGFEGNVEWRKARVNLVNATGSLMSNTPLVTFGVASESILQGPGGVFFGLIRDTDSWIRPSFLSQTSIAALQLDLRSTRKKTLTLAQYPLITSSSNRIIRLTDDLRRKYGDPVAHYTARAKSVVVNGVPLAYDSKKKPIYVIFDTGVTGMVVSRELFEERYMSARERRERNLWGHVDIVFQSESGEAVVVSADKPLTTPFDPQRTWKKFRGIVIVIGLSFLDGNRITIDIDDKRALFDSKHNDD